MNPSMSPRFQAAVCAAITARISASGDGVAETPGAARTVSAMIRFERRENRRFMDDPYKPRIRAKLVRTVEVAGKPSPTRRLRPYNLDLAPLTNYIKRVLRPLCSVALCLAALTPVFGQPKPTSTTGPALTPRPLPSAPAA